MQTVLTNHARDRMQERYPEILKQYPSLVQRPPACNDALKHVLSESEEDRTVLNNTARMVYLYDTYGYDMEFRVFVHTETGAELILRKGRDENVYRVVTVLKGTPRKRSFKKVKTKEQRHTERLLSDFSSVTANSDLPIDLLDHSKRLSDLKMALMVKIELGSSDVQLIDFKSSYQQNYLVAHDDRLYFVSYSGKATYEPVQIISSSNCVDGLDIDSPTRRLHQKLQEKIMAGKITLIERITKSKRIMTMCIDDIVYCLLYDKSDARKNKEYTFVILWEEPYYKYV